MPEKLEKFELHFQIKLLAMLIKDFGFLERYGSILKAEYFSDPAHQILVDIINKYWMKFSDSPTIEVIIEELEKIDDVDKLPAAAEALEEALELELEDGAYYEEKAVAFCKRQALVEALRQSVGEIKEGHLDAVVPIVEKAMLVGTSFDEESLGLEYFTDLAKADVERHVPKIPTLLGVVGSGGVDDVLRGGLDHDRVALIQMKTGGGKSVYLVNVAGNAILQGFNVAYLSWENSEKENAERFNVFFTGLDFDQVEKLDGDDILANIKNTYDGAKIGKLMLKTFPMGSTSVREAEAHLKSFKLKRGWFPDLVIMDYLDIVKPPKVREKDYQELKDISDEMKSFAQRHKVPIWTAGQVNRKGHNKKIVDSDDAGGSYDKLKAIDFVIGASTAVDQETDARTAKLFVSKNRQGKDKMSLEFELDLDRMRFIYVPREEKRSNIVGAFNKFKNARKKNED